MQKSKIRVLCFHPALAPYRLDFFNLLSERVDLDVVFLQKNLFSQNFDQGALLAQAKFRYRYLTTGFDFHCRVFRFGVGRVLHEIDPDVVLSYEASPVTLALCLRSRFAKWALWTCMDDSPQLVASRTGLRRVIRDWVIRHCNGVIVPSKLAEKEYVRCCSLLAGRTQFAAIPIIYDERRFRRNEDRTFRLAAEWRQKNLRDDELAAFFIGRLSPEKNVKWLLERVADTRWPVNLRLFLIGSGAQQDELRSLAKKKSPDGRIRFLGRHEGQQLQTFIAAQDIFILPSRTEPFGAVVSESLHWGAPCLISENVGARSLINGLNGRVFDLNDDGADFYAKLDSIVKGLTKWEGWRPSCLSVKLDERIDQFVELMGDAFTVRDDVYENS